MGGAEARTSLAPGPGGEVHRAQRLSGVWAGLAGERWIDEKPLGIHFHEEPVVLQHLSPTVLSSLPAL